MNTRCLIIDKMHESILPLLKEAGVQPEYKPDITRQELLDVIGEYTGLIVRSKTQIDREVIDAAENLRFIARAGAGIDKLDVAALSERGIKIINAPEGNRDALAEHAVGLLLCLLNKIHSGNSEVKKGLWDREGNRGIELMGKTVAIVGYGHMGGAFARRISSFGCRVIAYDKYIKDFSDSYVTEATMEQVFSEADILSLHIPLTEETLGLVDEKYLQKFKKDIYLINTARGEIVPFQGLVNALKSRKIRGAALDVLENEKIDQLTPAQNESFTYLVQSENVLLTPHVGGWSRESYVKINEVLARKIKSLFFR